MGKIHFVTFTKTKKVGSLSNEFGKSLLPLEFQFHFSGFLLIFDRMLLSEYVHKNRVENDIEQGNSAENGLGENSKYVILKLSRSEFPRLQDERAGISKQFLFFFTLFLY